MARNLRIKEVYFGWKDVERIYLRDEKRLDNNVGRRTDLNKHCVCLDQYTLMNATYAKSPFTAKTICEAISYLCLHLDAAFDKEQSFESEWHEYSFYCNMLDRAVTPRTNNTFCSNLALLKYQIAVHGLFVERLLCVKWKLNMKNITREKSIFKSILEYFKDWKEEIDTRKKNEQGGVRIIDAYFISTKTYDNLLTLVRGFFGICRIIVITIN